MIKELKRYVREISGESSIMVVEHRSNNPKRDYLFVNKIQGKHIPTDIKDLSKLGKQLSDLVVNNLVGKDILIIGFAETATCLGNIVANSLVDNTNGSVYYLQTTREDLSYLGEPIVKFEEKHSHAVSQVIYSKKDIKEIDFDYVLFVEDEISTGKTIINCIDELSGIIGEKEYGVLSVCNWQTEEMENIYKGLGIERYYLIGGRLKDEHQKMDISCGIKGVCDIKVGMGIDGIDIYNVRGINEREGYEVKANRNSVDISGIIDGVTGDNKDILILGTEEYMYIPYLIGMEIVWEKGVDVKVHATTRSSIDVIGGSSDYSGEIVNKYKFNSVYDINRDTYLYNIKRYDSVIVVTDSKNNKALLEFMGKLKLVCNDKGIKDIKLIRVED